MDVLNHPLVSSANGIKIGSVNHSQKNNSGNRDHLDPAPAILLDDVEAAMQPIFAAMNARYRDKESARREHQSKYGPTPRRTRPARRDDRK